jgi:hypothetical protein
MLWLSVLGFLKHRLGGKQSSKAGGGGNVDSGAAQADETEGNHNLNTDEEKAREV